jgi:glycerol kinase
MWLCIDQGGHSTRVAAFAEGGRVLAHETAALGVSRRDRIHVEHDPRRMLESVDHCVRAVGRQLGHDCRRLKAAGLATQRSTLLCASKTSGAALSPIISWQDRRGHDDIARFGEHATRIKELTGLRLSPHYGVGKLRWCMRNLDAVSRHLTEGDLIGAPLASYLLWHLTAGGGWRVDPVNASRTLLMEAGGLRWSDELLDLFGIPGSILPVIRPCRSNFGSLEIEGQGVPIEVVTGDQAAAVFCSGTPEAGAAFVNIGTGAFIQAVTGSTLIRDDALLSSIVWHDASSRIYVLEGTVNGAASAVDAVSAELDLTPVPDGPQLDALLEDVMGAPLFLNGFSGLGSPDWVADFETRFEGGGNARRRLAAVYESIAFLIMRNLERMRQRLDLRRLVVTGGLGRVDWLAQCLADLSELQVSRPAEAEATTSGLAFLLSRGQTGAARPDENASTFEPRKNERCKRRYRRWTEAMEAQLEARR